MARSYLEPTHTCADKGLDVIRRWLSGFLTADDFFSTSPPALQDLHSALMCAVMELKLNLDPQLEYMIQEATGARYNFELAPATFWSSRRLDVDSIEAIREPGIRALNRGDVMRYLECAKSELEWTTNEIRRLEVHLDVAKTLIEAKVRKSFAYRASPREMKVKHAPVPTVPEDEGLLSLIQTVESDDEMLDDEEYAERRARSRTPEPGEMSRYDACELGEGEVGVDVEEPMNDDDEVEGKEKMGDEDEDRFKVEIRPKKEGTLKEEGVRSDSVLAVSWGGLRLRAASPDL